MLNSSLKESMSDEKSTYLHALELNLHPEFLQAHYLLTFNLAQCNYNVSVTLVEAKKYNEA